MASPAYDGTNGGIGGKFRRKPFRKTHTTPYDRPPTAIRQTQSIANNNNNGWLAKIVDPASRMITAGARKFFSSVFQKRLLAPPSSPPQQPPSPPVMDVDGGNTIEHVQLETATNVVASDARAPVDCGRLDGSMPPSDSNGVAELEDILKQNTFSRSQIDHLTALLLSRTTENSNGAEKGRSEPKVSDVHAIHGRRDSLSNLRGLDNQIVYGQSADFSTPEVRSKMLPDDVASPAEIAKMYMGSRSTKVSPSVLRLQNQFPKEDFSPSSNPLSKPLVPVTSLTQKSVIDIGTSSKGLMTPRFRGRSAIYSMARTPYSRVHPVTNFKAAETNYSTSGGSSYLEHTENTQSKKQVLKRRSSVLENDIGSVGPIRRIRQKPNLLHPKTLSLPPPGGRQLTHVSGVLSDVAEVPSSKERTYENFSKVLGENSLPSSSSGYVPSQSVEMAQKIFEQLDKFSPKKNVDFSAGKSPMKTPDTEGPDSLKPLQSSQEIKKFTSLKSVHAPNHQLQTSSVMEEVNAKKFVTTSASLGPQGCLESKKADSYLPSTSKVAEPPKQRSFQMSAPEDYLDMDDDTPSNEEALATPLAEVKRHAESSLKSVAVSDILQQDQTIALEKPSAMKTTEQLRKNVQESLANGSSASGTTASFPSPVASLSSPASNLAVADATTAPQPILKFDGVAQQNEINDISKSSISKSDNLPPIVWSSQPAAKDTKLETPIRVESEVNGPDKTDIKSTPVFGNSFIKSGDPASNGSRLNDATPVNGEYSTLSAKSGASDPDPFIGSSRNPSLMFSNGGVQPPFSSSTSSPLPSSSSDKSGTVKVPVFSFAAGFSSSSVTSSTSASDTTDKSGAKSNVTGISNTTGNLFDAKPFAFGSTTTTLESTGGDVQTAGPAPTAINITFPFQTGTTHTSSVSPSSSVSVPTSTASPSFPGQSATSVSVPASTSALSFSGQPATSPSTFVFGSSGSTGPSSGSIFGSFSPSVFSSGPGSTSSALGSSFTSSSLPTSSSTTSIFGVTSQSPKPASTIAPFPTSSVFTFGSGSSGAASSTPAFGATFSTAFGATSTAPVFGATTSASASNSLPFVFGGNSGLAASTPATANSPFQSQPAFGNSGSQPFAFASTPSTNNEQMTMEDTMAEDSSQPSTPPPPIFGAPISVPSSGFAFNAAPAAASPFQFNTQPSQVTTNHFQPSGSLEFNGGSSFSLGANDKSQRRIVRVKKGGKKR